jgi:hypothetical protein
VAANPFTPGAFYAEQPLFGREEQFELVDSVVEQIDSGYPHAPVFFLGPSGLGKTSILRQIANDLKKMHWLCGYSEAGSDIGSALYDVLADAQQLAPSRNIGQRILSRITNVRAGAGPVSIGLDIASIENGSAYTRLVDRFQAISDRAMFEQVGAALLIDEAQGLPDDHLEILFRALGAIEDSPIVLFMAALPCLHDSMALRVRSRQHGDVSDLAPLDTASAEAALIEPVGLAGGEFEQGSVSHLVDFACGHPLTLQMLGRSAWDFSAAGIADNQEVKILEGHASKAIAHVRDQLKRSYYRPIWHACTHEERILLKEIARIGGTTTEEDLIRAKEKR